MAIDVVQKQMLELNDKVDTLQGSIEQLTEKVNSIAMMQNISTHSAHPDSISSMSQRSGVNTSPVAVRRPVDPSMTHKDVLSDEPHLEGDSTSATRNLSSEVQIQRLTAQLTAAYNRMAALEEQILACRFQ